MRFVILGAGAVGATIGGMLAEAGFEVTFLARGEHARVMAAKGLQLSTHAAGRRTISVPVVQSAATLELARGDILIAGVKSQDSAQLFGEVATLRLADTGESARTLPIICAQNGIASEREALRLFAHVYGMCIQLPAQIDEPGQVSATGAPLAGIIDLGCYPSGTDDTAHAVAEHMRAAGFGCVARPDIMAWKNRKLIANLANALEVLVPSSEQADCYALVRDEGEQVLAAAGLPVVPMTEWIGSRDGRLDLDASQQSEGAQLRRQGNSTFQSVQRGNGTTETDHLNGEISLQARLIGLSAPRNELIQHLMQDVLSGRRTVQSMSGTELLDLLMQA